VESEEEEEEEKKRTRQRKKQCEGKEIGVITLKETITRFSRFLPAGTLTPSPPTQPPAYPVFFSDTHLSTLSQLRV
jgi:hypothetical protein